MILNFKKSDFDKARLLLNAKENNISSAEIYIEYLNNHPLDISKSDIETLSKKYPIEKAFYKAFLKKLHISEDDLEYSEINSNSLIEKMELLDQKEYLNNPYYNLIKNTEIKDNDWIINMQKYYPFEGFVYDELIIDETYFSEHTPLGFFDKEFSYPAIIEKDLIWMSIIPHEINTMKEAINNAKGNVLVFGLGLGYYAYMISLKKEVKKITIIEKDPKVIKIFKDNLLNKFEYKDKINIINEDAFNYINNCPHYDYAFIDIYHNVGDGFILYLKLKGLENIRYADRYDYWIETSLLAMLRRYVLTLYEEKVIYKYSENDYLKAKNENDEIINKLYHHLKDYQFNSYDEFHDFLKDDSLRKLAKELRY